MNRILVTGGAGFIGTNLCKKLLTQGHEVIAVDNLITSTSDSVKQFKNNPKFTFIKHDITQPLVKKILDAQHSMLDVIFHLACPTGVDNLVKLAEEMLLTCSLGTRNVLELAKMHNAKVLFTSSSEIYGDPEVFPQTESYHGNVDAIGIRSSYEEGKRLAESLVMAYIRKFHIDAKIVRVFNTYGPYMSLDDSRVIPRFIQQCQQNRPLTVTGNGLQTRTFCYVDDVVDGLLLVLQKGKKGEVYNLGNDKEIAIIDLAKLLLKISGSKNSITFIERPSHDHNRRLPSLQKVKQLGWQSQINLEEGLKRTLQWYGSNS